MGLGTIAEWVSAVGGVLALLAAIRAISLQSTELRLQRQELQAQRDELHAQREELTRSAEAQQEMVRADHMLGHLGYQIELVKLEMSDSDLRLAMADPENEDAKIYMYLSLWMSLHRVSFDLGRLSEEALADIVGGDLFNRETGVLWWQSVRAVWESGAQAGPPSRFMAIVGRECDRAAVRLGLPVNTAQ